MVGRLHSPGYVLSRCEICAACRIVDIVNRRQGDRNGLIGALKHYSLVKDDLRKFVGVASDARNEYVLQAFNSRLGNVSLRWKGMSCVMR